MTDASEGERALETHIKQVGLPTPVREYAFHPGRKWRFDFAWPDLMVAVEVEGGIWSEGGHNRGKHFTSDAIKYNEAAIAGWLLVRVTTDMVESGEAIVFVERAIKARTR